MNIEIIPVTAFQQNCSIIWDNQKNAAIIDPGGEADKLIARISELELNLQGILLTHGHLDHVGAADKLRSHFGVQIIGPQREDEFLFDSLPQQSQKFGLFTIDAFKPDRWLEEGEQVQLGDFTFDILYLPGHTPGHIGFIERARNIAFSGDVLFKGSIGRTDFPRSSHSALIQSIKEKMYELPDDMIVMPGHGGYTTIGQEKATNPFVR